MKILLATSKPRLKYVHLVVGKLTILKLLWRVAEVFFSEIMSCKGAVTLQLDRTTRKNPCTKYGVISNFQPPNWHHMVIWDQSIILNQSNCNIVKNHFKLPKIWLYDVKSWPNIYMLERTYLGIMLFVYSDLRNSNIFHPLFILTSQTMLLGQVMF